VGGKAQLDALRLTILTKKLSSFASSVAGRNAIMKITSQTSDNPMPLKVSIPIG